MSRKKPDDIHTITDTSHLYLTVAQFSQIHPAFPLGGMRHLIFNEHENGLAESGAVVRLGGKVLIHVPKFFRFMETKSGAAA